MKIVIAPDSFKGTLSAIDVCQIIKSAIEDFDCTIDVVTVPIADGGEGTVDAFLCAAGGEKIHATVKNPLFIDTDAYYAILKDGQTAVIEMAQASGLTLVDKGKKPLEASPYGTGQLIAHALDKGCTKIVLGLGGSATTDGGIGAAAALGARFLSKQNTMIPLCGGGLSQLDRIDFSSVNGKLADAHILLACDVDNTLYGNNGSAHVFAPQKGADAKQVETLDSNLRHYAKLLYEQTSVDYSQVKGGGAAGGLAISLMAIADAQITPGIDVVLQTVGFEQIIKDADLIITGEGKTDAQTLRGKVPVGIAHAAKQYKIPVIAISGSLGDGYEGVYQQGIDCIFCSVREARPFEEIKKTCREDLYSLVRNLCSFSALFRRG